MNRDGGSASKPSALQPFRCDVVPARDRVYVQPVGDLDLATAPVVAEALDEVLANGFEELVIDLRAVTFMDSTGLRLLLERCGSGKPCAIVPGPDDVERVFAITGTSRAVRRVDPSGVPRAAI